MHFALQDGKLARIFRNVEVIIHHRLRRYSRLSGQSAPGGLTLRRRRNGLRMLVDVFGHHKHVIRHHPAIGQIHIFLKLDRDHFRIDLHDRADQPITNTVTIAFVVAQHFDLIPDVEVLFPIWRACEI